MTWSPFLGIQTRNNAGVTSSVQYDSYARPSQTNGPHDAVTNYAYGTSPPTITATTDGQRTRTTPDSLGRTIKVETGGGSGTKSLMDSAYAAIALDPLGKSRSNRLPTTRATRKTGRFTATTALAAHPAGARSGWRFEDTVQRPDYNMARQQKFL